MKIKILYFGRPSENLHVTDETVEVPDSIKNLDGLLSWLHTRGPSWAHELTEAKIKCAINQEFSGLSANLSENDEVAIFSPISGG